jgi:uncharacterized membrane protein (DUF373 family)
MALDKYGTWLSTIIRIHAYAAATFLMLYMIGSIVFSFGDLIQNFEKFVNPVDISDSKNNVRYELLHSLAFIIVLYKAYSIILYYAKDFHVNIKFVIEIAIIGSIVEIIFNYKYLSDVLIISYTVVFISASITYLYFYKTLNESVDEQREGSNKH